VRTREAIKLIQRELGKRLPKRVRLTVEEYVGADFERAVKIVMFDERDCGSWLCWSTSPVTVRKHPEYVARRAHSAWKRRIA
jgi:hypothetical protein